MNYGNDEIYLWFYDDADEAMLKPARDFIGLQLTSATSLTLSFFGTSNDGDDHDDVIINFTSGKHKQVCRYIAAVLKGLVRVGGGGIVTVADNKYSVYGHQYITSCGNIAFN